MSVPILLEHNNQFLAMRFLVANKDKIPGPGRWSEGSLVRRVLGPKKGRCSENEKVAGPKHHVEFSYGQWSENEQGSLVRKKQ